MKKTLILASIASLLAAPAFAAEEGFYAGANIGASQQDINGAGTKTENPTTWVSTAATTSIAISASKPVTRISARPRSKASRN